MEMRLLICRQAGKNLQYFHLLVGVKIFVDLCWCMGQSGSRPSYREVLACIHPSCLQRSAWTCWYSYSGRSLQHAYTDTSYGHSFRHTIWAGYLDAKWPSDAMKGLGKHCWHMKKKMRAQPATRWPPLLKKKKGMSWHLQSWNLLSPEHAKHMNIMIIIAYMEWRQLWIITGMAVPGPRAFR